MSLAPVPSEQPQDAASCANCGTPLAPDQRYCLACGQPVSPVRLAFLDVLQADAQSSYGSGQGQIASLPSGYASVIEPVSGPYAWMRRYSGLFGLLSVLLLAIVAGLLVGHWVTQSKAPSRQVLKVEGLGRRRRHAARLHGDGDEREHNPGEHDPDTGRERRAEGKREDRSQGSAGSEGDRKEAAPESGQSELDHCQKARQHDRPEARGRNQQARRPADRNGRLMSTTPNGNHASPADATQELGTRPVSGAVVPVGGLVAAGGSLAELRRRRHELAERVAALTWDLGGLTYEMAVRDHYRLDVLARKAAELQEADAQLGEVQRLLGAAEAGVHGQCHSCGAVHTAAPPTAGTAAFPCWWRRARRCSPKLGSFGRTGSSLPRVRARRGRSIVAVVVALAIATGVSALAQAQSDARPHNNAGPHEYSCPIFPAEQPAQPGNRPRPRRPQLGRLHREHRADRAPAPGLRDEPELRHPLHGRRSPPAEGANQVHRIRRRIQSWPLPDPANAPVEGAGEAGDRHVLVLQEGSCKLYELYNAQRAGAGWEAGSGAVFNLRSNALRPNGWTSADAAGLPIFPLLVRYPEVRAGQIDHALRVTVQRTQAGFIHPATHFASIQLRSRSTPDGAATAPEGELQPRRLPRRVAVILRAQSATA